VRVRTSQLTSRFQRAYQAREAPEDALDGWTVVASPTVAMELHWNMNSLRTTAEQVHNVWALIVSPEVVDTENNGKVLELLQTEEYRADQTTYEMCACPCMVDFDS
jgi:hypothetical protein